MCMFVHEPLTLYHAMCVLSHLRMQTAYKGIMFVGVEGAASMGPCAHRRAIPGEVCVMVV